LKTTTLYNNNNNNYSGVYNSTETRIIIWKLTIVVIKNNLIFGTGTGDIKDELNNQYENTNFIYGSELHYNCHNQILQIIATFGIFFGFPLILILFKILHDTIKNKNMLFSVILLIFIINFLFESFLETKAGVETFVLFCIIIGSTLNQNRNLNFSSI
jgi:O-antigen ligase